MLKEDESAQLKVSQPSVVFCCSWNMLELEFAPWIYMTATLLAGNIWQPIMDLGVTQLSDKPIYGTVGFLKCLSQSEQDLSLIYPPGKMIFAKGALLRVPALFAD